MPQLSITLIKIRKVFSFSFCLIKIDTEEEMNWGVKILNKQSTNKGTELGMERGKRNERQLLSQYYIE